MADGATPSEKSFRPPEEGSENGDDDLPRVVTLAGDIGLKLAYVSLAATAIGIVAMYLSVYPFGRLFITVAFVGISLSMILAMVFQAYAGNTTINRGPF
ncbi:hypothetical protein OB919_02490 [Halobacteria archaeon AArc-curdl1]|uniref:Uncharacterized protein n=1 Tax=Natronosalvus hydrolyticus TaxID=2979988 RepID=A0AAP2Z7M7_9EURY|nr:hypothetical protein [Halobacteria archaeon AArc-curdl1]